MLGIFNIWVAYQSAYVGSRRVGNMVGPQAPASEVAVREMEPGLERHALLVVDR